MTLPPREREAYERFEEAMQKAYVEVRQRVFSGRKAQMDVLVLLSRFRQVINFRLKGSVWS